MTRCFDLFGIALARNGIHAFMRIRWTLNLWCRRLQLLPSCRFVSNDILNFIYYTLKTVSDVILAGVVQSELQEQRDATGRMKYRIYESYDRVEHSGIYVRT